MSDSLYHNFKLPPEQQAIRDKCFHPSGTFVEFPLEDVETSIPERFEKIVHMYPDRLAMKMADQIFTYDQLNRAANAVAQKILAVCGHGNEPIALLVNHKGAAVICWLAVLKAGKICVPLDSSFPYSQLVYMLEDSQARLIIAEPSTVSIADGLKRTGQRMLVLDANEQANVDKNTRWEVAPTTFAAIVYTSGSTGQPKGVLHSHRNILYNVLLHTNAFHVSVDDRMSLTYSFSFSPFLKNLGCALLNGATVLPFDVKKEGSLRLSQWLVEEEVTIFFSTGSLLTSLTSAVAEKSHFPCLRAIYVGSEAVKANVIDAFRQLVEPDCIIAHAFASNESGTATQFYIDKALRISGPNVPVGYAVGDRDLLILDGDRQPIVRAGEVGEIAIRSRYFATGYWRQPELTLNKFLADPDGGDRRIYLTGDQGRIADDGCLYHLGRKDFQIKIRGFRIEPVMIESALVSYPGVKEAVVIGSADEFGIDRLIAYFTVAESAALTVYSLREYLKKSLPEYMIPSVYVQLETFSRTATGKIDRRALPNPAPARPPLETPYVTARTPIEEHLVSLWSGVLGLDRVGVHDNFFELGGHSLAASQVISRVIQTFQLELSVKALFDAPTVAEMAAIIAGNQAKRASERTLNRMLSEVEAMTEEETQKQLAVENARSSTGDGRE
jgi:amino acid adenylation domain-containing protein